MKESFEKIFIFLFFKHYEKYFLLFFQENIFALRQQKSSAFCKTKLFGALEGIRTPDLLVRSQTLYPTELPAHILFHTLAECLIIISYALCCVNPFFYFISLFFLWRIANLFCFVLY